MKKVIVLLLISFSSFSQFEMGFGAMADGSLYLDYTFNKKSGFGFDIAASSVGTSYGRDYSGIISLPNHHYYDQHLGKTYTGWSGMGAYYITPEYKGFSGQIGLGGYKRYSYQQFYDRMHILSSSGDYRISDGSESKRYISFGISKTFDLGYGFSFELKQYNRLDDNGKIEPTVGASFRMGFNVF